MESQVHSTDGQYSDAELSIVEWHMSWPGADFDYYHNTSDNNGRRVFYGISGVPAVKVDGLYTSPNHVAYALGVATDCDVTITGAYDSNTRTGDYSILVTAEAELPAGTYYLYVALTQDPTVNQYGTHYDTMRQAFPNYGGTALNFTGPYPQTIQVDGSFAMDYANESGPYAGQMEAYDEPTTRLVAWAQEISGKKVHNSDNVFVLDLGDLTNVPDNAPAFMAMGKSYPNPFNPTTAIPVKVDEPSSALLQIVGVDGRIVATLHEGELTAGDHEFSWNGTDAQGNGVASGVYMARLITRAGVQSDRLVMLK